MNVQIPIPSSEDVRKLLGFWIDQQDKWFYFETGIFQYSQSRIVGKIQEVVECPPSLLLKEVTAVTANLIAENLKGKVVNIDKRKKCGLVLSQVTYYEPLENYSFFPDK